MAFNVEITKEVRFLRRVQSPNFS